MPKTDPLGILPETEDPLGILDQYTKPRGTEYTTFDSGRTGILVTGKEPTGAIDVRGIGGERPIMRAVETDISKVESPNFGAIWKASFADDLETQIEVYAPARFPDIDPKEAKAKYETAGGKIYFKDTDGIYKEETPTSFKKLVATTVGRDAPAIIMGGIGAIAGPFTAALGAAGGVGWRKLISSFWLDEPQTSIDTTIDIAIEGTFGYIAELGGVALIKTLNRTAGQGKPKGRKLAEILRGPEAIKTRKELLAKGKNKIGFAPIEDADQIERLISIAKQYDLPVDAAALTGNPALIDRLNILAELSDTADMVSAFKKTQNLKTENAIPNFLDNIAAEKDPFQVGTELAAAAEKAVKGLDETRHSIVSPYYKKAFASKANIEKIQQVATGEWDDMGSPIMETSKRLVQVDDRPIISVIDGALQKKLAEGTPSHKALTGIKDVIQKADGNLEKLHNIKVEDMDVILKRELEGVKTRIQGDNLSHYTGIVKKALSKQLDTHPDYVVAKAMHELHLPPSIAARQGLTGNIARLKGDDVSAIITRLFASSRSNVSTITNAKKLIYPQNPQAWEDGLRSFMEFRFSKVADTKLGDTTNMGAVFGRAFWGNSFQKQNLKAAMSPEQFRSTTDFMDIVSAMGLTFAKDGVSPAARAAIKAEPGGLPISIVGAQFKPLVTTRKLLFEWLRGKASGKGQRELAEVLLDPRSAQELARLKQLTPKTEELIRQFAIFAGIEAPQTIETIKTVIDQEKTKETIQ